MKVKLVVACQMHRHGGPGLFFCEITGTASQYHNGDFYDAAKSYAEENDWEGSMVAIDEKDGPAALFKLAEDMEWVQGKVS
jgi:hypothetical protein